MNELELLVVALQSKGINVKYDDHDRIEFQIDGRFYSLSSHSDSDMGSSLEVNSYCIETGE